MATPDEPRPSNQPSDPASQLPPNDPSRPQPSLLQGLQTISLSEITSADLLQKPCVRDSLLVGLGTGFAIGGTRFIFSSGLGKPRSRLAPGMASGAVSTRAALVARQWGAMSWAVGAFVLGSSAMHLFCQRRRQLERESMRMVREAIEKKREEKRAELMDQRRRSREQKESMQQGGGWKHWFGR